MPAGHWLLCRRSCTCHRLSCRRSSSCDNRSPVTCDASLRVPTLGECGCQLCTALAGHSLQYGHRRLAGCLDASQQVEQHFLEKRELWWASEITLLSLPARKAAHLAHWPFASPPFDSQQQLRELRVGSAQCFASALE